MKKVLIIGKNSYIGTSLVKWLENPYKEYSVSSISIRDNHWENLSFKDYDILVYTAGIAHIKENKDNEGLYYRVNTDLAFKIAKKAKQECVKQFIYISSMSVYGKKNGTITKDTKEKPQSIYGKSKLEAEKKITTLEDNKFKVSIVRPPMVYGENCKGNFVKLKSLSNKINIFPNVYNYRSMIYIDNLCEFLKITMDNEVRGILFPQNKEYICTSKMVKCMKEANGQKMKLISGFNFIFKLCSKYNNVISKVFGDLVYDKSISDIGFEYNVVEFEESIRRSK